MAPVQCRKNGPEAQNRRGGAPRGERATDLSACARRASGRWAVARPSARRGWLAAPLGAPPPLASFARGKCSRPGRTPRRGNDESCPQMTRRVLFGVSIISMSLVRHPEARAQRASKDAAEAHGPSPFEARYARTSG